MAYGHILVQRNNKTIYRDGDKLIKLFGDNYIKSDIFNEALCQARVLETGLNIPKIHEVTVIDGKSAIVMDYIEGTTLDELLRKYPEKHAEFITLFVRTQRDVHSRKHLLLTKYSDKLKMKILQSELAASTRYDLSMRLDGMRRHTHVLHGDFIPSNVILTKDGTPYIVDWSHASQGNATADAVKTYLLFRLLGHDALAEAYCAEFLLQAGISEQYFREWIPLIAAAQLVRADDEARKKKLIGWVEEAEI